MLIGDVMSTGTGLNAATTCLVAAGSGPFLVCCLPAFNKKPDVLCELLNTTRQFASSNLEGWFVYDRVSRYEPRPLSCEWYYGKG